MQPNTEQKCWMYEHMLVSRYFEEAIEKAYLEGKTPAFNMANGPIPGEMHLSNGQEPCGRSVRTSQANRHRHLDSSSSPRGNRQGGRSSTNGGRDLRQGHGPIRGRGGHMHIFDPDVKLLLLWHRR